METRSTASAISEKPLSVLSMRFRAAGLRRAGAAPKLRSNGCTEAVRAQRVLTLQMQTYGSQVVIGDGLPDQLAIGGLAGRCSLHDVLRNTR